MPSLVGLLQTAGILHLLCGLIPCLYVIVLVEAPWGGWVPQCIAGVGRMVSMPFPP